MTGIWENIQPEKKIVITYNIYIILQFCEIAELNIQQTFSS